MIVAGIDPGMSGAIVMKNGDGTLSFRDIPTYNTAKKGKVRRKPDIAAIREIFTGNIISHVFIEKAQSMPRQGVASVFNYALTYGVLLGVLASFKLPYTEITSQAWKKVMLCGMDKSSKDAARYRASQLWPNQSDMFRRKKDEHRAEAALIAEYGWRTLNTTEHTGGKDES